LAANAISSGRTLRAGTIAPAAALRANSIRSDLGMNVRLAPSPPLGFSPRVRIAVSEKIADPALPTAASANAALSPSPESAAAVSLQVSGLSEDVAAALESAGDISQAKAENASAAGSRVESVLTRAAAADSAQTGFAPSGEPAGDHPSGVPLARPAGQEIAQAAQAYYDRDPLRVIHGIPEMRDQGPSPQKAQPLTRFFSRFLRRLIEAAARFF